MEEQDRLIAPKETFGGDSYHLKSNSNSFSINLRPKTSGTDPGNPSDLSSSPRFDENDRFNLKGGNELHNLGIVLNGSVKKV